ncbi:MAG: hypothetical protein GHCLOJNM_01655 [bacterium]|nr:hypothetical protein [bacterium]
MKALRTISLAGLFLFAQGVFGQAFDSGSDGTDGALVIGAASGTVTLNVPEPDGIFNFTTITIQHGATLMFTPNRLNTPVYMLATGDVNIDGDIDIGGKNGTTVPPVGGQGGPGGFAGGDPALAGSPAGPGHGPGGAHVDGRAAHNGLPLHVPDDPNHGVPYGSPLLVPLVGGSGGGGSTSGFGGGGGGGALLIASNTQIILSGNGDISAIGGAPHTHAGSSGSVRLVSPKVSGNGRISVFANSGFGAVGRVRIDTINRRELSISINPGGVLSVGGFMRVFADPAPSLALTHVAGKNIPEGTTEAVMVFLPNNAPTTQQVTVQARNYSGQLPIRVTLNPDSGSKVIEDATIDMTAGNPNSVSVMMDFPVNTPVSVEANTK